MSFVVTHKYSSTFRPPCNLPLQTELTFLDLDHSNHAYRLLPPSDVEPSPTHTWIKRLEEEGKVCLIALNVAVF